MMDWTCPHGAKRKPTKTMGAVGTEKKGEEVWRHRGTLRTFETELKDKHRTRFEV
uniref:Uncharacterized protein n=1 Tax=Arion vulgaris TaxID=1028688 RepID=A0A0B7AID9_9EUPU